MKSSGLAKREALCILVLCSSLGRGELSPSHVECEGASGDSHE